MINTSFWSVQFGTKFKNKYLKVDKLASNRARFSFILSSVAARVSKTSLLKFSISREKELVGMFSHINARINPNSMQKAGEETITKQLRL